MPTSGLVLTLAVSQTSSRELRAALEGDSRIIVGDEVERRLPIVTETSSLDESEQLAEAIGKLAGVVFVDVVSIDFSDIEELPHGCAGRQRRQHVETCPSSRSEPGEEQRR